MQATAKQKQLIHLNCKDKELKQELVQLYTGDTAKKSTNDLNFDQANAILVKLGKRPLELDNWALYDNTNGKHRLILSLLYQANWVKVNDKNKEIPDLKRFNYFLHSEKSPVQKPLKEMTAAELEKVIKALNGIVKYRYK